MNEDPFRREVGQSADRKLRARRRAVKSIWSGFGMFGLVGWSVTVPTMAGCWLGIILDSRFPSRVSWTLTLLVLGLCLGAYNAWHWLSRQNEEEGRE